MYTMKVNNISTVNKLKNGEFLTLMNNVIAFYDRNNASNLNLGKRLADLQLAIVDMEEVFQSPLGNDVTPELSAADSKRGKMMRALKLVLDSILLRGVETAKPASSLLNNYLLHGGTWTKLSAPHKTSSIDALRKDWMEKPNLTQAMTTLGLNEWMTILEQHNNDYKELYLLKEESARQNTNIRLKRANIKKLFDELVADTEAHIRLTEDNASYIEIIKKINTMMRSYRFILNGRQGDRKKETAGDMDSVLLTES